MDLVTKFDAVDVDVQVMEVRSGKVLFEFVTSCRNEAVSDAVYCAGDEIYNRLSSDSQSQLIYQLITGRMFRGEYDVAVHAIPEARIDNNGMLKVDIRLVADVTLDISI